MSALLRALRSAAPWAVWCAAVFGVLNAGASMSAAEAMKEELRSGVPVSPLHFAVRGMRIQLSDFGDAMRYAAYANAMLGRPYQAYFVRTSDEWEAAWRYDAAPAAWPDAGPFHEWFDPEQPGALAERPLVPWKDFVVEYPPGFLPWIVLPAVVAGPDPTRFGVAFSMAMAAVLTAALVLSRRLLAQLGGGTDRDGRLVLLATAATLALGVVTTHRFDPVASLAFVAAFVAAFSNRPALAGAALGVGAATKLVPGLAAVPIAIYLWHERRRSDLLRAGLAAAGSFAAVWLYALALAGARCFDLLRYHGRRPLEVESTGALLLAAAARVRGAAPVFEHSHGSVNVAGPGAGAVMSASRAALAALGVAVIAVAWRRMARAPGREERRLAAVACATALLAVFMDAGAVFSPQYVVWLLPIALVAAVRTGGLAVPGLLAVCALTQAVYPTMFSDLTHGQWLPIVTGITRNAALAWLAWRLLHGPATSAQQRNPVE
jgi:hypothetical protein